MQAQLQQRLQELKAEYEAGQKMLAELEARQTNLQHTLLRISGAIQVLEEELAKAAPPGSEDHPQRDGAGEFMPASNARSV
jgi:hypothetical protein